MAVLIPVYWHYYGPTNFLYFCDIALILTLVAIWREDALLVSMCSIGIVLPQMFWVADFLGRAAGYSLTGRTDYMFDASHSLFLRLLSLFHGWLPFLLIYLVWKIGYDRRALGCWTGPAWALLLICFFLMPPPTPGAGLTPVNINYVWGMSDSAAQSWVPPYVWFVGLLIGLPLLSLHAHAFCAGAHHAGRVFGAENTPRSARCPATTITRNTHRGRRTCSPIRN
jgi:hypothetical protein